MKESDEKESALVIFCFVLLFGLLFVFCSWLYYHGFYTGYYDAFFEYKQGTIDNKNNERFEKKYNSQNHLPFVKP